ncbi:MAG: DUF1489 domain-containing protein [Sphingobium sp.]|jgi:hypothetical protein|nr:DUF1489 domain-containing protein [Sphingobium sp.]MCI1270617.1 DUF1489 domain-containing protein [Sphingobium sp.]MCI1757194.1 DUF1489 domain-containing protein [Sphingobium sp.]MCI2052709.1 DUF1489 domain-containing protein [Sphingobium sp.]
MPLNLTKIAYRAESLDEMMGWFAGRGPEIRLTTRYLPKRHAELIGGSLYWILRGQMVARSLIKGFEEAEGGKTHIVIESSLIAVMPVPKRAHQGWRYLEEKDAPPDLGTGQEAGDALPATIAAELGRLGLV